MSKTNKEILNEAFFKKKSFAEKQAAKMSKLQYEPVSLKAQNPHGVGVGSQFRDGSLGVTDVKEVKKRLTQGFGAMIGNNTIRSVANRAVKTFPIIISDNVSADTAVMLKKLFEEQYAEYLSLVISNSVVDLSSFSTGDEEGNIAMQALDSLTGVEFGSQRIARKAMTGELTADDLFKNYSFYNLIRQESAQINTGDPLIDMILENAIIVESKNAEAAELALLTESRANDNIDQPRRIDGNNANDPLKRVDPARRNHGNENLFGMLRDKQGANTSGAAESDFTNRRVSEVLSAPGNEPIRDRFEKATFLLQSSIISGSEYISYLTIRLGIPISQSVRKRLVTDFKIANTSIYRDARTRTASGEKKENQF